VLESLAGLTTSVEGAVTARVDSPPGTTTHLLGQRQVSAFSNRAVRGRSRSVWPWGRIDRRPTHGLVCAYASLLQFKHPRPEAAAAANRRYGNGRPFGPGFVTVTECGVYRAPGHMARSGYVREANARG
jgi:hypothetical protein